VRTTSLGRGAALLGAALVAAASACHRSHDSSGSSTSGSASRPAPGTPLSITIDGRAMSLAPRGKGYDLDDANGHMLDRVKVESDHVKVESDSGQLVAEVKRKDYGFKVEDGAKTVVIKAKSKGARWKLKRPDGTEVAKIEPGHSKAGSSTIDVARSGDAWTVTRDGAPAGSVGASVPAVTAAFVGLTELPMEQRVGIVVYLREVAP
jgi:hypothetical protein